MRLNTIGYDPIRATFEQRDRVVVLDIHIRLQALRMAGVPNGACILRGDVHTLRRRYERVAVPARFSCKNRESKKR